MIDLVKDLTGNCAGYGLLHIGAKKRLAADGRREHHSGGAAIR